MSKHTLKYQLIGNRIQQERKKYGLTQIQLAERVGISKSYITKIEAANSDKSFSLEVIFDICDTLEIPLENLFQDIKTESE